MGVDDGRRRGLAPEQVPAQRVGGVIFSAVMFLGLTLGLGAAEWLSDWPFWMRRGLLVGGLVLFLTQAILAWVWPVLEQRHTFWWLDEEGLRIRRGVLWRHAISVPRRRIQHTDVSQGPLQRRFGLARLIIHTAGTHAYEISLDGLRRETALEARDALLRGGEPPTPAPDEPTEPTPGPAVDPEADPLVRDPAGPAGAEGDLL